jgi:threonine dehydrogenase-like Zn-dependent dehydrogenase
VSKLFEIAIFVYHFALGVFLGTIPLTMRDKSLPYDLVVIGAGPHGLIAAHTWLELYPESRVAILESEEEVG